MRIETSHLVKQHLEYCKQHPTELQKHDNVYDHMFYYFTSVLGMLPDTAQGIVDDFKSDFSSA